jgi:uncharacterized lipoprotein YddW (UPF0748 family)
MKRRDWISAAAAAAGAGVATLAGCAAPRVVVTPTTGPTGAPSRAPEPVDQPAPPAAPDSPPPAPREFRAAWVATVAQIDWPSAPGLPVAQQQAEATAILDRARDIGLNALVLQVRPAGDAFYPSALEPWSEYLTGAQGLAPVPAWDPLAFWVDGAHRRGLELHAWFNPYRARHSSAKSPLAPQHIGVRAPHLVKPYGDMLWMDPGEPECARHLLAVVSDVLRRYAVDGVHIDDYFYPYPLPVPGAPPGPNPPELPFPDEASYARYRAGGGPLALADWRRANVDTLVQALYATVQAVRPGTRVGISPFGIGRPDRRPPGISGFSQFDKLYADVERWLAEGWLDYLAPQLYWPIDRPGQQFPVLLDGWLAEQAAAAAPRHLWPGLFTSQVVHRAAGQPEGPRAWPAQELLAQIALQRQRADATRPAGGATGHIHFSMVALMQDRDGIASALRAGPYATPALVPATPWAGTAQQRQPPAAPRLRLGGAAVHIEPGIASPGAAATRLWAVWRQRGGAWAFSVQPEAQRGVETQGAERLAVSAVSTLGVSSENNVVRLT